MKITFGILGFIALALAIIFGGLQERGYMAIGAEVLLIMPLITFIVTAKDEKRKGEKK